VLVRIAAGTRALATETNSDVLAYIERSTDGSTARAVVSGTSADGLPLMRWIDELFTSLCGSAGATRGWFRAWPFRLAAKDDAAVTRMLHPHRQLMCKIRRLSTHGVSRGAARKPL
jgi:hypothetical protein